MCSQNSVQKETPNVNNSNNESDSSAIVQYNSSLSKSNILLLTCSVIVSFMSHAKNIKIARLLLDNGYKHSWCTKSLAIFLKLKLIWKERLSVYTFVSVKSNSENYDVVKFKLTNRDDSYQFIKIETLITDTITSLPFTIPDIEIQDISKSNGLALANECRNID